MSLENEKHKVNPRELALQVLLKVEKGSYSNLELNAQFKKGIDSQDKKLAAELVYGVIKNRIRIDYIISKISNTSINKLDDFILNILRIGVYQIIFLDKIPPYAAVSESVNLAKKYRKFSASFVNAVLRNIIRKLGEIEYPDEKNEPERFLSVYYSFPRWMVTRWVELFGFEFTKQLLQALNEKPKLCVRVNTLKIGIEELQKILIEEGYEVSKGLYLEEAIYFSKAQDFAESENFKKGYFQPQDEGSLLVVRALGVQKNDKVLDAAAAPGGKTTYIAQIMENKGEIVAWDLHPHRLELINKLCERLGVTIVKTEQKDAGELDEKLVGYFDRVLLDAPCSGLGVIRRKPDIKWSKKAEDILSLRSEQQKLLKTCSNYVKPGGIIVYSTCTIEPLENEDVIYSFLSENKNFQLDDLKPFLPERLHKYIKDKGMLQTYPNIHGIDGFFIARIKRIE